LSVVTVDKVAQIISLLSSPLDNLPVSLLMQKAVTDVMTPLVAQLAIL